MNMSVAFPSYAYAEAAMNSIAVDPAFTETKTRKTTIKREMTLRNLDVTNSMTYLDVQFSSIEEEVSSLRTCVSSFTQNLTLVCDTMKHFGN